MGIKKHLLKVPVIGHLARLIQQPNPHTKHLTRRSVKPRINYENHGHE